MEGLQVVEIELKSKVSINQGNNRKTETKGKSSRKQGQGKKTNLGRVGKTYHKDDYMQKYILN